MVELENSSPTVSTASREVSGYEQTTPLPAAPPLKKKRNLPGMPDPEAEVIALSPKALLATNRFVCEICNKGFQRDQNLQLHRRGHNLPWKLKQRTSKEVRKRVYVCPEPSCVHHSPGRALGDLTGIKKHFCRKHGEKKWKCERCSKKYAVQSDWKAHMKTCGTREYKCDCGTIFSRRDSFITHRAFCDALAEESARTQPLEIPSSGPNTNAGHVVASSPPPPPPPTPTTTVASPALSIQSSELSENPIGVSPATATATAAYLNATASTTARSSSSSGAGVIASIFAPPTVTTITQQPSSFSNVICAFSRSDCPSTANPIEPASLSLSTSLYLSNNGSSSIFATPNQDYRHYASSPQPAMSATALLQKAAQMGAAASNASLLRGFGLATSSSSGQDGSAAGWNGHVIKTECSSPSMTDGLGLRLPSGGGSSALTDHVMMGGGGGGGGGGGSSSSPFGSQPMTRDLLGLGRDGGGTSTGGLSALLTSFGSGFDVAVTAAAASLHNTQNNDS